MNNCAALKRIPAVLLACMVFLAASLGFAMDAHLAKPYDIPKMMDTIEKILNNSSL